MKLESHSLQLGAPIHASPTYAHQLDREGQCATQADKHPPML